MRSLWLKVVIVLVAVWAVAGGLMLWASHKKVTPEKLQAYLERNPVAAQTGTAREKVVNKVADQLNGLSFEQRREVRMGKQLDGFFRSLTPAEQAAFLDRTLPTGFKQMMESFNKMEPAKRRKFVERTLNDMRKHEGEGPVPKTDDPHVEKIVQHGLKSFYSEANADVKMDLTPLIEQMQKNIQSGR